MTQFYQAFPRVSTASDKRWGEKAWVQGYCKTTYMTTSRAKTDASYLALLTPGDIDISADTDCIYALYTSWYIDTAHFN